MPVIKKDSYSLYIKQGGYIFRPIFPVGYSHVYSDGSQFSEKDKAKSNHRRGTPLASVKVGDISETWFNHGDYLGNPDFVNSESCYKPTHHNWG